MKFWALGSRDVPLKKTYFMVLAWKHSIKIPYMYGKIYYGITHMLARDAWFSTLRIFNQCKSKIRQKSTSCNLDMTVLTSTFQG